MPRALAYKIADCARCSAEGYEGEAKILTHTGYVYNSRPMYADYDTPDEWDEVNGEKWECENGCADFTAEEVAKMEAESREAFQELDRDGDWYWT